jgi:predicted regulator of Ras-like GTPase activity (Roadblock/LC7/MglB family)
MLVSPISNIQQELAHLNARGEFALAVLTDGDGLPLAAATPNATERIEMLAAVAPLVQRMVQRSNERAGLSTASEVVVQNADGSRLICRFFRAREQELILACVVPKAKAFRREMNTAIRAILKAWDL